MNDIAAGSMLLAFVAIVQKFGYIKDYEWRLSSSAETAWVNLKLEPSMPYELPAPPTYEFAAWKATAEIFHVKAGVVEDEPVDLGNLGKVFDRT